MLQARTRILSQSYPTVPHLPYSYSLETRFVRQRSAITSDAHNNLPQKYERSIRFVEP